MAPKGRTQTGLGGTTTLEANEGVRKHPKEVNPRGWSGSHMAGVTLALSARHYHSVGVPGG